MAKITLLGAGAWAIALSGLLTDNEHQVTVWEVNPHRAGILFKDREDPQRLPGKVIPYEVKITSDLERAVAGSDLICFVLPSHTVREVARALAQVKFDSPTILNLAKGIENETLCRMSEILLEELPERVHKKILTLSGPSLAKEVSQKIPTTVVVAGFDESEALKVQKIFMNSYLRVYTNEDLTGVELGGALKNIIAIAAGICDGLGLGENSKGALLSRGLAEMIRLGEKMGAKASTFSGLSGMGDLVTTCFSRHSRNRYVGEQIGKGKTLDEVLSTMVMVAEGVKTTRSAHELAKKFDVEMPITEQVYQVLFENKKPSDAIKELMVRDPKKEFF